MLIGVIFFILGSIISFLVLNGHRFSTFAKDNNTLILLLSGIPINVLFYYAWNRFFDATSSAWGARFINFSMSYLTFPILAYIFLNENPFTLKVSLSVFLSILIMYIQFKL